jgi:molybdate transport system substrate-binding protein
VSTGCGSSTDATTLTISAASSLTGTFTALGRAFEESHPGITVTFNFGGSSALAEQIVAGAPVDVFASASTATMDTVMSSGRAVAPVAFATNSLAVAVPPANPGAIRHLADLARPGVSVVVCQASVPCGAAAGTLFTNAGLTVTPVSLEPDVTSVLAKVTTDEVDAGIVYVTDLAAVDDAVAGISIPDNINVTTTYMVTALSDSRRPDVAAQFVAFVLSAEGQRTLTQAGFGSP